MGTRREIGRGRIRPIWVNPDKTNSILIGSNSGGLWKTTNGGDNWTCLTNNLMTGGVFDIAVNPNDTNIIYIATGTRLTPNGDLGMSNNYSLGIFKSIDGGSSWTKLSITTSTGEHFRGITINPADSSILYALSSDKVYKSTDSGSSWTTTSLTISTGQLLTDIVFKPNDPNTIYVSGYQNAIYKSTDAGANWINLAPNMLSLFANSRIAIATNPEVSNELYAFYCNVDDDSDDNIIEKSIDGGNTWDTLISQYLTGVHYAIVIKLSPEGDIYAGGINLWKSTDGGNTFPDALNSSNIHVEFMDVELPVPNDNDLIYVTTDGGVYMDMSGGHSWDRINGDLATNEFYDVGILPGNSDSLVGGTHDCGSYLRDNNGDWNFESDGDGGTSLYDHANGNIYYLSSNRNFFKFSNNTETPIATLAYFNAPVCMNPMNSKVLYYHKKESGTLPVKLKKTSNRGDTWETVDETSNHIRDITICEGDTNFIYYCTWEAGTGIYSRIRKTEDGGTSWTDVNYSDISGIRQIAPVNSVHVHPFNPNQVWSIFGGFEENDKIFYSEDKGESWKNITGSGLPNLPVQCFQYDFLNQKMYVGTDVGVYYCSMNDNVWAYTGDLPRCIVSSMKLNKTTGDLVISTFGRGIWNTNLGAGYCYQSTPINISTNTTWSTDKEVCSDINVNSGILKITVDITMSFKSVITIKSNAVLEVDGGSIINGKILVENGGDIVIKNNGKIKLNNGELEVQTGGEMDFSYGEIDAKQ